MRRDRGRFVPGAAPDQLGHAEVDNSDTAVFAEHELRWGHLGVSNPALVRCVERSTGFEPDHQRLRWLEEAASVEKITQTAAAQVFDHPEKRRFTVDMATSPQSRTWAMFG